MNTVRIGEVEVGKGMPKVIVPIVAKTREEILDKAREIRSVAPGAVDMVEWRADFYDEVTDVEKTAETGRLLREILREIPFLFTFRTAREGGEKEIPAELYTKLNQAMAERGGASCVDVEMFSDEETVKENLRNIHACGIPVIGSRHSFAETPAAEVMVRELRKMQDLGADILKIAVMPKSRKDVAVLLSATADMCENYADRPLITMSMGPYGMISRISGEVFGSSMTFGALGEVSAPGQLPVSALNTALRLVHDELIVRQIK
ncbi:type I 3-dehydroquinate dehydratase [[Clostridium] aminophilum]|uniref:type I 3-dehydroquinate dehydratase n=1 Tax=[Clostridium] aminophilum TaxID=1526 RepID=UPI00331A6906